MSVFQVLKTDYFKEQPMENIIHCFLDFLFVICILNDVYIINIIYMGLETSKNSIEWKNNILKAELKWTKPDYVIEKWKKYVREVKDNINEKDFSDWESSVNFISGRNPLWLWEYEKALELMMNIDVIIKHNKLIWDYKLLVAKVLSNNQSEEDIEYQNLKELFTMERDKFKKKYKEAFTETFWEGSFDKSFKEIVECIVAYYDNSTIAKIFKESVL